MLDFRSGNQPRSVEHKIGRQLLLAHLRDVVLAAYLRDTDRAMVLDSTGRYSRPDATSGTFNAQQFLLQQYSDQAQE